MIPSQDNDRKDLVVGYAYATQFRPRPAYASSVEITIYCHPDNTGMGYGKLLLDKLLFRLREVPKTADREHGIR